MAVTSYVVDKGLEITTSRLKGLGTEPNYAGWGTGTTTATPTDTGLETASAEARVLGTSSQVDTSTTKDTYQVVVTITSASGQTISEVCLFDAITSGNCFFRSTFTAGDAQALLAGESIEFTIKAQYNQA